MLFQRLYNWIKYKTLPPSILFKNRLYIERDSKHKRIFNNFGLIFRNSKWTNYETYNVKTQFRLSFYKYFFLFFFITFSLLFIFKFQKYYICLSFFNYISYFFWIGFDALDYYFSFLVWLMAISVSLFSNILYSYFFFNNFSENENLKKIFSHKFFSNNLIKNNNSRVSDKFSKHDLNWIFYFWLNFEKNRPTRFIENIFENPLSPKTWNNYHDFFIKLYKTTFFCSLTSSNYSILSKIKLLDEFLNPFFKGNNVFFFKYVIENKADSHFKLISSFFFNNFSNRFNFLLKQRSVEGFNFLNNHNFFLDRATNSNYTYLFKNKTGSFFFHDFSFENLNFMLTRYTQLIQINGNLTDQLNTAKWDRWLYRYSLLHRKIIKNSHKTTMIKKLLNSGFYNNDLFDKNIWASENFQKFSKKSSMLNSYFNTYYPSLFGTNDLWNSNKIQTKNSLTSFNFLNFYEKSYFWFLKRFYTYNSLQSNSVKNKKHLNLKTEQFFNNVSFFGYNDYLAYFNFFVKTPLSEQSGFSHFTELNSNLARNFFLNDYRSFYATKDTFLSFDENSFLNMDNLKILYWITSPTSHRENSLIFSYFNYTNGRSDHVNFSAKFYSNTKCYYDYKNLNEKNEYLKDFSTFGSFFNKR